MHLVRGMGLYLVPVEKPERRLQMFKIRIFSDDLSRLKTPLLFVPVFQDQLALPESLRFLEAALEPGLETAMDRASFQGKLEETLILFPRTDQIPVLVLLGAGKVVEWDIEHARRWFGATVKVAQERRQPEFSVFWEKGLPLPKDSEIFFTESAAAMVMATYRMKEFQRNRQEEDGVEITHVNLVWPDAPAELERYLSEGLTLGRTVNHVRHLADLPPNVLTPGRFVEEVRNLAPQYGWKLRVLDRDELEAEGLNCILAVASGSANDPYLVLIEHNPADARGTVGLVGKGVTFDSGGISIKPSKDMDKMKYDMCGAAAVLGAMEMAAQAELPVKLVAAIPLVENLPSHRAMRPSDIIRSYSGQTVEILNTDAEGRLILADALSYVDKNFSPDVIIDLATLTGAIVVALGHLAAGVFSTDGSLIEQLEEAGNLSGERVWSLPMWSEYEELLKSRVADVANIGSSRGAGSITAALFLKKFVHKARWAHIDIAGTAWEMPQRSYRGKGPTGFGVRLLYHWLKHIFLAAKEESQ
ncbi:MAG: leucyl aminopeptidase [Calditrichaeota bacterium]|nr:MAG: leucyl aminopeptidase [Calditrichota bacterium]